jgi:hypothetical protein
VRDPQRGGCAVLAPDGFVRPGPPERQTRMLGAAREGVNWQRMGVLRRGAFDFDARAWRGAPPGAAMPRERRR